MNSIAKKICAISLMSVVVCSMVGCGTKGGNEQVVENYPITLLSKTYNGKDVSTVNSTISRYFSMDNDYRANALYERADSYDKRAPIVCYDYQKFDISWESTSVGETYTVYVSDNKDFNNSFTYTTKSTSVSKEIGIFVPNQTYYYKVVGSKSGSSKVDSFKPVAPVRYISADTVLNVRDLGGWKTKDGKTLNYGKIYRGAAFDEPSASHISNESKNVISYLGLKGEIDLRGNDEGGPVATKFVNKIDANYPILREGLVYLAYENMFTDNMNRAKNNLPKIFEFLANEDNYPVYFHCSAGADRTGTLAFIIEALLGVEYENLMIDFELTSFTDIEMFGGTRQRSTIGIVSGSPKFLEPSETDKNYYSLAYIHKHLMQEYSGYSTDLQKVMEKYLRDVGVSKANIDKVKEIMIAQ